MWFILDELAAETGDEFCAHTMKDGKRQDNRGAADDPTSCDMHCSHHSID